MNQSINQKKIIRHAKKINGKFSVEKLFRVNWQCFIEQIIRQVDKLKKDQIDNDKSLYILQKIEYNFRVSRRIYAALYQDIYQAFQRFLHSLDFDEIQALNLNIKANGRDLLPIENYPDATELMQVFDVFYYIKGRFSFTTGFLPIPDGNFPAFVGEQEISIKKLYE